MDKELTIPKWVLIVQPKIPQMSQKISSQNVCPSPKVWDFWKKNSFWVSVVRVLHATILFGFFDFLHKSYVWIAQYRERSWFIFFSLCYKLILFREYIFHLLNFFMTVLPVSRIILNFWMISRKKKIFFLRSGKAYEKWK